jgi:hypothetical protein
MHSPASRLLRIVNPCRNVIRRRARVRTRTPSIRHAPQIPHTHAYPTDTSSAADPMYACVPRPSSAADPRTHAYPSIRHPQQIPAYARVPHRYVIRRKSRRTHAYPVDTSSAADPLYTRLPPPICYPPQIPCRSALAREYVGSGDARGAGRLCLPGITPKTACTPGSWFRPNTDSQSQPAPAAPDAVRPPAPPSPPPPVHPPSHGCGNGTSKCSTDRPAC